MNIFLIIFLLFFFGVAFINFISESDSEKIEREILEEIEQEYLAKNNSW